MHVAIQDAMGWLDYHLHEFRLLDAAERNVVSIGIPTDDDPAERPVEGRCPPEDCGGVHGYAEFLEVIADPDHEEHQSTRRWAGGHFDPDAFDPGAVMFDDPKRRWRKAFARSLAHQSTPAPATRRSRLALP